MFPPKTIGRIVLLIALPATRASVLAAGYTRKRACRNVPRHG